MGRFQHVTGADSLENFRVISTWTAEPNTRLLCENGGFTITLPAAPLDRDQVQIIDINGAFGGSNVTIARNGFNICNLAENLVLDMNYCAVTLEYSTANGWLMIR